MALLALVAAVGGATAVPDARITIDEVEVSSSEPTVGERTTLNLTVTNSAGSPSAAEVTSVRLLDATVDDADPLDEATRVGSLSAGDSLDARLWTRFDEPGERRLTVEVVAEQEATDGDADDADDVETVTVTRDVVIDVQPSEVALDLRTRALAPGDLQSDEEGQNDGISVGGIEGVFGGGGDGGLDTGSEDEQIAQTADSPVAVTVVNTGTTTADRVSLRAVGTPAADAGDGAERTLEAGPYVVEDVAPGEERRVVVDLGPLDRQSDVTFTAAFRSGTDAQDGAGAERTAESTIRYPPREGDPIVTDATVRPGADGEFVVEANLGNAGSGELSGAVVSVADAPGVEPTPAGAGYFVGTVGPSDFVAFDLGTTANASVADEVPIRIEYTEQGVRYTETATVALPDAGPDDDSGSTLGALGTIAFVGAAGLAIGGVVRRRDV